MLNNMSSRQMAEWRAFWQVEPFGAFRDDWRFACLLAMLANMFRDAKEPPIGPMEFMPLLDPTGKTEKPPSAAERASNSFEESWKTMMGYE